MSNRTRVLAADIQDGIRFIQQQHLHNATVVTPHSLDRTQPAGRTRRRYYCRDGSPEVRRHGRRNTALRPVKEQA